MSSLNHRHSKDYYYVQSSTASYNATAINSRPAPQSPVLQNPKNSPHNSNGPSLAEPWKIYMI